ncbi:MULTISPECIES: solute carrier family 23 protein [unclassified Variovorax]|uniref:solute carrier family 23 protein n=1 Tax=unclassified Variovorax TaxID=663243 RepID=UPI00076C8C0F|nr:MULTISPECIES: solute carrier family 23 protein [unclassified Variovorax]KWT96850.1 Uracil permease [Variovorax sp. WDL1]PNG58763.1 putative pyrimidine permease RutG [Variovorax sp. B4]PNG61447.1 putative pyrimidine permease RutG [Variovorax sp. B2]VTV12540.1 Putative pyrimidine permease RutG [Variovorax sp. WDL1]
MSDSYLPRWRTVATGHAAVVAPDERLPWPQTIAMGVQHVIAMFGATVLAPILMGFNPNIAILMSGVGTLIFFLVTGGRVPSYLGSSFAFIGVVIAATGYAGQGPNANLGVALGGIIACGAVYVLIGVLVALTNERHHKSTPIRGVEVEEIEQDVAVHWIERLMPPVVTGAVVAVIGLNLASVPIKNMAPTGFDTWMQALTFLCVGLIAVYARGMVQRLLILMGLIAASLIYAMLTNGLGLGKPIDLGPLAAAPWFGLPSFTAPVFEVNAMLLIAPVAVILVAENLGHIKAVSAMTGRDLNPYLGRAFVGDGIATMVSGAAGGTGVTTYAENIGVMAATKIYSTAIFVVAALIALLLGFSPKFGALIQAIPLPVMGGVSIVVFGLIAVAGAKIWVDNRVDFSQNRNLIVAAITLILGTGDFTLKFGQFALGGIGTATFGAILLYAMLNRSRAA